MITPNLWFDGQAEQAAEFYCSVFPNSRILSVSRYPEGSPGPAGEAMVVEWELNGQHFSGINGGPQYNFSEAVSFAIGCADQGEVDRYWEALTADGGQEGPCGWLKDKFGVSWQVVPDGMEEALGGPHASEAFAAMMTMTKLDIATLRRAAGLTPA